MRCGLNKSRRMQLGNERQQSSALQSSAHPKCCAIDKCPLRGSCGAASDPTRECRLWVVFRPSCRGSSHRRERPRADLEHGFSNAAVAARIPDFSCNRKIALGLKVGTSDETDLHPARPAFSHLQLEQTQGTHHLAFCRLGALSCPFRAFFDHLENVPFVLGQLRPSLANRGYELLKDAFQTLLDLAISKSTALIVRLKFAKPSWSGSNASR